MIVKLDHISYSCTFGEEESVKASFKGYQELFCEENIENLSIKSEFMQETAKEHCLYMLAKEGCYSIEITSYPDCCSGSERLTLEEGKIRVRTSDVKETESFYEKLGFCKNAECMSLKPLLDKTETCIQVELDHKMETSFYLDQKGWGILAFVVDNAKKQKRQLESAGITVTDIQELAVNGRNLKIFFAKSNAGDLVELIGIR